MTSVRADAGQSFRVIALSHVNVTVPEELEDAAKHFYGNVLGLTRIEKPPGPRQNVGAWYELGNVELHLSVASGSAAGSDRHVCYLVENVFLAERYLHDAGVEIIPDSRPVAGSRRFYIRDPGGNLIEIAEA
jgi:catechol 2,3-dioxygenase-like lactoylglutathione lyase family enzyme